MREMRELACPKCKGNDVGRVTISRVDQDHIYLEKDLDGEECIGVGSWRDVTPIRTEYFYCNRCGCRGKGEGRREEVTNNA